MPDDQRKRTLEDWLTRYGGVIRRLLRAYAFTAEDREDLLQEVALGLWDSLPRYRAQASPSTWIYRISLYTALAWSRREGRRRERQGAAGQAEEAAAPEVHEDPRVAWLYEQIASLPPVDRSLLLLQLEGQSQGEIAQTLGLTESHVSVKLHRIRRALAERGQAPGGPHGS